MPALTRKRVSDHPETWHIHYAGVRVGMLLERSGIANTPQPWEWHCGFYPGSNPGEQRYGTATSFEAARAAFEAAWREYLPKRGEADFQAWRDERLGQPRSIAGLIAASECRMIGAPAPSLTGGFRASKLGCNLTRQ